MRKFVIRLFCALLLLPLAPCAWAQDQGASEALPPVLAEGLDLYKYKTNTPEAAVRRWVQGGPLEGSKEAFDQIAFLRQLQNAYGSYQGYEVFADQTLSSRTQVIYLVMHFVKGPLFAKFIAYQGADGWILTGISFSKDDTILPTPVPAPSQ